MIEKLNTEKCYLLGLLIGGGILKSNTLQIVMPYKKWGSLKINPSRGGDIAEDILRRMKPLWKEYYNADINYKIDGEWKIIFENISQKLLDELKLLKLGGDGEFRDTADISELTKYFSNVEMVKSFIAGLVDTVGSLALSHRRFSDNFQIVSIEFKGKNFKLVSQVVNLLVGIGCIPDQILWNHPNQHSGSDRYYKSWKKGFKVRVSLDDYFLKGSFVFQAKQLSAIENKKIENKNVTVLGKESKIKGRTSLHIDENCQWLPEGIRGLHFIHYTHFAEYFGIKLPSSPVSCVKNFEKYVSVFTILTKGTLLEIENIVKKEDYLNKTKFRFIKCNLPSLLKAFDKNRNALVFGNSEKDGFPINQILQGVAFIIASTCKKQIRGKRVLGNYVKLLRDNADCDESKNIKIGLPNVGTCLYVKNKKYATLIGYINDDFIKKHIKVDGLKVNAINPTFDNCVVLKNM